MSRKRQKRSLAEQIAELSTPKPALFHPDEEDLGAESAAKVCDYDYEEEDEGVQLTPSRLRRRNVDLDEDPRYAGRAVSRSDLEEPFEGDLDLGSAEVVSESDQSEEEREGGTGGAESADSEGEEEAGEEEDEDEEENLSLNDQLELSEDKDMTRPQSDSGHPLTLDKAAREEGGFSAISLQSIQEEIEKGKAAKLQIGMWDGLLEGRIRLQKALTLCNRMPQPDTFPEFRAAGGQQLETAWQENQTALRSLLDNLLELQQLLLRKNRETCEVLGEVGTTRGSDDGGNTDDSDDDEEILSDMEEGERDDVMGAINSNMDVAINSDQSEEGTERDSTARMKRKRKRKAGGWVLPGGARDYEGYIAQVHESLRPFQDRTLTKWNNKTRLTSGRVTSKAFVQVDHSVVGQIQHVLKDRQRLLKRTQLKRSVYRILGKREKRKNEEEEEEEGEEEEAPSRDDHLKEYDEEIFDDDDFYHQLLRELIERKMNFTETSDPIAMGRQWLELQKLRTKVKKKVDTKASKGRRIRYNVHPKLVNFMAPVNTGTMSDISRNDLFSSVFGGSLLDSAQI